MTELQQGLVISHLGQGIAVETSEKIYLCQTRRKLETVTVGDQVMISKASSDQGRIEQLLPRRSLLQRPSRNNKTRPVAANIDKVYIVFAVEPACDFLLIDQYLAICENKNITAVLVLNKVDLQSEQIEKQLQPYQSLSYPIHRVSASENSGITELKIALNNHTNIFTGQSGVGKSSLTNVLIPDKQLKTNTVSKITKHGRHTTTVATLYHLPEGGDLIDSPGVAIFGLADLTEKQLAWGYREFQPLLEQCKFNDCRHVQDMGCAVRLAAEAGDISTLRYQRFLKLREKILTL
ncbi:MAG: ribosome small subunit-dependent GTPase A [Methylococcales symbiont of Hymedesmia sp. n. MRB-2018]|nr:MAG: ribosome small subunit-dependent GTPase A [Methylococcales symbiont of Hymedesmia sp. n. MRB-2018]KAF3984055.1 MAG: ribosome small subunit-dependent GTPase A [Methylococcales symbiont of Hymedesmia sp. n. MRB-2018]